MAGSSGAVFAGALPGLTLRAWALVQGAALVKGFNVSAVTNPTGGEFNLTLTQAMPDASITTVVSAAGRSLTHELGGFAVGSVQLRTYVNGVQSNPQACMWIGIYG